MTASARSGHISDSFAFRFDLTQFPPKMRTHTLRKKLVCTRCGLRRPELELIWEGG